MQIILFWCKMVLMIPIYANGRLAGHFNTRTGKMQRTTGFLAWLLRLLGR